MSTCRSVQAGPDTLEVFLYLTCASITNILLICSSFLSLQFHNTRSQKGEKEKEKEAKQPDVPLDSDEEPADAAADLSLMARTKRLAKEAKAAELRRQLAELDQEDSLSGSDMDPDQVQDHPPKDMGAFVAAAVSSLFFKSFICLLYTSDAADE